MEKYQNKYRIDTVRLPDYDYSQNGEYSITICTHDRIHYFGKINDGEMLLNDGGLIAKEKWLEIPSHFPQVILDEFIIIPDHIHGIIVINKNNNDTVSVSTPTTVNTPVNTSVVNTSVETQNFVSLPMQLQKNQFQHIIPGSIGSIVRGFKIGVTKWFRQNTDVQTIWQRNYYEHIIRNEQSLCKIRNYIRNNPANWDNDASNHYNEFEEIQIIEGKKKDG